ncbi:hypothetical protein Tco_1061145 [Tanacetum coccineum]
MMKERYLKEIKTTKMAKAKEKFKCGDSNHLIGECPKVSRSLQSERAFVGGSWSYSDEDEEEKTKDEKCLMAKASNEVTNMPRATVGDTSLTRSYIPKVSQTPDKPVDPEVIVEKPATPSLQPPHIRSSSHQGDDDEDDGASRASTPSPATYINSLKPLNY